MEGGKKMGVEKKKSEDEVTVDSKMEVKGTVEIKMELSDDSSTAEAVLLNKLPGELRNHIYRLALVNNAPIVFEIKGGKGEKPISPGLLQTCHKARNEATAIYYNENKFTLSATVTLKGDLQEFSGIFQRQSLQLAISVVQQGASCVYGDVQEYYYGIVFELSAIKPDANRGKSQGQEQNPDLVQRAFHALARILKGSEVSAAGNGDLYEVLNAMIVELNGLHN